MKRTISPVVRLVLTFFIFIYPLPAAAQVGMDVSPDSWNAGDVELGSSVTRTFEISSTGLSELVVYLAITTPSMSHIQICGIEVPCDFVLNSLPDFPDYPSNVPAGTDKHVTVTFTPSSLGFHEEYLYILNNSPEQNYFVNLMGEGVTTNNVPEPATMILLGCGLVGLAGYGRKKLFRK